jgi:uncharacterized Zn-binding protein involved in type VI secretion
MAGGAPETTTLVGDLDAATAETPAPAEGAGGGAGGLLVDLLAIVGIGFEAITNLEQQLTAPLGAIPWGPHSAMRMGDWVLGAPHPHTPIPIPLPPFIFPRWTWLPQPGPVLEIGFLSGAGAVQINGIKAARCGDMGVCVPLCLGFLPAFEVFFGSANVWIEGQRAARTLDPTSHCTLFDPPIGFLSLGLCVGAGSPNVLIGGVPLPSLTDFAIGKAFEALFSGVFAIARRILREIRIRRTVNRFMRIVTVNGDELALAGRRAGEVLGQSDDVLARLKNLSINGDVNFQNALRRDLRLIASTDVGDELLNELADAGHRLDINCPRTGGPDAIDQFAKHGDSHYSYDLDGSRQQWTPDPDGPYVRKSNGVSYERGHLGDPGVGADGTVGSGSRVVYDPTTPAGPNTPTDVTLFHELSHANRAAHGMGTSGVSPVNPDPSLANVPYPDFQHVEDWKNLEEEAVTMATDVYAGQRGFTTLRGKYSNRPP